ncbi:MAG TPA: VOC family protein [Actinomycetales bacterium]|nr:VOC family protein [Actinomycetales bacterium]
MDLPRLAHITVDCEHAASLASFWARVLGWEVGPRASEQFASVGGANRQAGAPSWLFFKVPEGKTAKNRMHVDLQSADLTAELERLLELGASVVHSKREAGTRWFTLTDPEGNEFCIFQPETEAKGESEDQQNLTENEQA